MKKIFFAAIMLCLTGLASEAQECPANLTHYWKLEKNEGGFEDHVGGLAAQVETETLPILGIVDSGQYFNGLSEISVPDDITFDWDENESFSIEFWIKKASVCPGSSGLYNNVVIGRDDQSSDLHWWAGVDCQNPGKINFTLFSNGGTGTIMKTHQGIIDGNWHHIVIVRNGEQNSTAIYLDNELDTAVNHTYSEPFNSIVPVNIGWLNRDSKYHLDASLDELAIHNVALSEEVISDHYNNGNGKSYCTGIGTAIKEIDSENLFNVYPTIAVSEFHVSFTLKSSQIVKLTAYDVTGKKISELLSENMSKGFHNIVFNTNRFAKNSVVLLHLKLDDKLLTKKIIIQ